MAEKHGESSSFITPDSLRKILNSLKNLYESHTKKYYGKTDTEGAQYAGTVENFGSEILMESRKMHMDKPPMMNLFLKNTVSQYFDLEYSDLIHTYDQQNMICGVLKKDVLLDNKEYYLQFEDCSIQYVLRSESWSDPVVKRDTFLYTKTPPKLIIRDKATDVTTELDMVLKTDSDNTEYYFHMGRSTEMFVHSYDETSKIFRTNHLQDSDCGLPFIWICVPEIRQYENVKYETLQDYRGNPLLTIGTDGHAVSRLYPLMYGEETVPIQTPDEDGIWYMIARPKDGEVFVNSYNPEGNFNISIKTIQFVYTEDITKEPFVSSPEYVVESEYSQTRLSRDALWKFRVPKQGDYDYDGTTYMNKCVAYTDLRLFMDNTTINPTRGYKPIMDLIFDDKYLTKYEKLCGNAVSGMHVNSGSSYSDNSISKENGLIHDLCEFDGLPKHFKQLLDRNISCPRVTLYAIRDKLNDSTQTATDKQTAALILDSAVPKNDMDKVTSDMDIIIRYDETTGHYVSTKIDESMANALSEITYVDGNTFGNSRMLKYANNPKFVYHGSRTFSTGIVSLDPEIQYGRGYYISNDSCSYENNALTNDKKPNRTLARICDIPTSFIHLINIKGKAPTIIIDEKYVRQEANLTRIDLENIWNHKVDHVLKRPYETEVWYRGETFNTVLPMSILPYGMKPSSVFDDEYLNQQYYRTLNLNPTLNLYNRPDTYEFQILNSGSGYSVNDKFKSIIGGLSLNGTVMSVDSGKVTNISFTLDEECIIHPSLLDQYGTILQTTTVSGSGTDLKILLKLKDGVWESLQPIKHGILDDLMFYQLDKFGNVHIRDHYNEKTNTWGDYQLTGERIAYHECDMQNIIPQEKRSNRDSYISHMLLNDRQMQYQFSKSDSLSPVLLEFPDGSWLSDLSYTTDNPYNQQDSIAWNYLPYNSTGVRVTKYDYQNEIQRDVNWKYQYKNLPRFHDLVLVKYYDMTNTIRYDLQNDNQPKLYLYLPNRNLIYAQTNLMKDIITIESSHEMSFIDILGEESYRIIDELGNAKNDIYYFNDCTIPSQLHDYQEHLESLGRESLVQTLREIDPETYPLCYEGTPYAYTSSMLVNYIMTHQAQTMLHHKNGYQKFRDKGSKVYDYQTSKPVGEQPRGKFENISQEVFNPMIKVNGSDKETTPLVLFRINEDITSLKDFRLYDDEGYDISDYAILIMSNKLYIHDNGTWTQIQTRR